MNKRDPNREIDDFGKFAHKSIDEWKTVQRSVAAESSALRRELSRDAFFRLAVRWEVFRSDWHIAAVARNTTVLRATAVNRLKQSVKDKEDLKWVAPYLQLDIPRHPTLQQVRDALDPEGGNLSLSSNWADKARSQLAEPYQSRITKMPVADLKAIELADAIRNSVAHSSRRSLRFLRAALAALEPCDKTDFGYEEDRMESRRVPIYLHTTVQGGQARVERFHLRLAEIAEEMRT